ncbi:MAG: hypothetical protein ACLP1X_05740 [Polyangiaceae bacterium]
MNVAAWVREIRRLVRALYPEGNTAIQNRTAVGLHYHPEGQLIKGKPDPEYWSASCGAYEDCRASTPEDAAAALIARLETELAKKIAHHRAQLAQLEASQAAGLRVVRTEKPS